MKKTILFILLGINLLGFDLRIVLEYPALGYGLDSSFKDDVPFWDEYNYEMKQTLNFGLEIAQDLHFGEIGVGALFEEEYSSGIESFGAVPVYVKGKIYVLPTYYQPYLTASIGQVYYISEKNVDMEDGRLFSFGLGVKVENFDVEVGLREVNALRNNSAIEYGHFYLTASMGSF